MELHNQSDCVLVKQYIAGQTDCLEILIDRYKNRVFSYIMMVVKNRELAEDIFQDTFIKVIRSLDGGTYKDDGRFCPWVMRIAHNLIIDFYRRDKHLPTVSGDDDEKNIFQTIGITDDSAEDKYLAKQSHADLKQLISKLPDEQRAIVKYRYVYDMSFKEIAELTGVSINTALGRMRYAIINLRKMMNVTVSDE
ncbi:MAG: sigma-70 family RNA polymerase sigma factor [Salinivirgaceae bacterium]|nr:sigma-70 family RNA polymerase sigma factor [Salinivirgaceae bacterium]MBR4621669.1 sigma-70 family RNA polymerase sigma factor [Salinivirgaceae bacterium]